MKQLIFATVCLACAPVLLASEPSQKLVKTLLFEETIALAVKNDPWIDGSVHKQKSLDSLSIAAGELPDPKISVGLVNLAADTFDFDQERMTHLKLGVTQQFPRGNSRQLKKSQLSVQSLRVPFLRADRVGQITVAVGSIWLDLYETQESIRIVKHSRRLFENLVELAESSYSSAISKTNQLDIIQAELELSLLDDRLTVLEQKHQMNLAQLSEWFGFELNPQGLIHSELPDIQVVPRPTHDSSNFTRHPAVLAVEKKIESGALDIELAEQQYKPAWSLNVGYGYRSRDPLGFDRSDLLSVNVNFDLPIFTANKQDKGLESAVESHNALLTEKEEVIRRLMSINAENSEALNGLMKRAKQYEDVLIPQTSESVAIALRAYSNDEGAFDDVIRAQISGLDASLQLLKIKTEIQKRILNINYSRLSEASGNKQLGGLS